MNKKGQIYILVALVLVVVIFGLVTTVNMLQRQSTASDFEAISDNFATESTYFLNSVLQVPDVVPGTIKDEFIEFTKFFTDYTRVKNPNYELVYAFKKGDDLFIGNFMEETLAIQCYPAVTGCQGDFIVGCYAEIGAELSLDGFSLQGGVSISEIESSGCVVHVLGASYVTKVYLSDESVTYVIDVQSEQPELAIVSQEDIGEQKKVFVQGNFAEDESTIYDGDEQALRDDEVISTKIDPDKKISDLSSICSKKTNPTKCNNAKLCEYIPSVSKCLISCSKVYGDKKKLLCENDAFCEWVDGSCRSIF